MRPRAWRMHLKSAKEGLVLAILATLASGLIIGCGQNAPTGLGGRAQARPILPDLERKEAPLLQELVERGELLPLHERLPRNPAVVEPVNEPGRYGGVWHRYAIASDAAGMARLIYDPALRWSVDGLEIRPNMCWKYEVSEDYRSFTFWLREGVKWSDGRPLTTEDVRFWFEDNISNTDLYPLAPNWIRIQGKLPKLEILDPHRFRFVFPHPYGLFLERVAWEGNMWLPSHYLKRFHVKYRDKAQLEKEAEDADFRLWFQYYQDKAAWQTNHELPMCTAWVIKNAWSSYHRIFERNPYYWKVDTYGRQLPYLDRVTHDTLQDSETVLLSLIGGGVLMQSRHVRFEDLPLLREAAKKGRIHIYLWTAPGHRGLAVTCNQTYTGKDLFARDLLQEVDFRRALSHALPREELNELFSLGIGRPQQTAPIRQSPYFKYGRKLAHSTLEYDLEKANRLLDGLGLAERDPEGYRLRPDGETIALTIDYGATVKGAQKAEYLAQRCLRPLGIKGIIRPSTGRRGYSGLPMLTLSEGFDRNMQLLIQPYHYIPYWRYLTWATQYGLWYESNGRSGWKPPKAIARIQEIYDEIKLSADVQKRHELMGKILDIHAENLWIIGGLSELPEPVIVSPRAGNIPKEVITDWLFMSPGNAHPEQFYAKW